MIFKQFKKQINMNIICSSEFYAQKTENNNYRKYSNGYSSCVNYIAKIVF